MRLCYAIYMKTLTLYPEDEFIDGKHYSIHWWSNAYTRYHRHSGFYELVLTNTSLFHTVDNETTEVKEHSLLLIPPMIYHKLTDISKTSRINHFNLAIKIEYLDMLINNHPLNSLFNDCKVPLAHLNDKEYAYLMSLAEMLICYYNDETLSKEYLYLYLTNAFSFLKIHQLKLRPQEINTYAKSLKNELDNFQFINHQIADFYSKYPIHPAELISSFKKLTGCTIVQYAAKQRIILACNLLANTHLTLQAIACKIGYNSVSHFIRVFKAETGLAPSEYRASRSK